MSIGLDEVKTKETVSARSRGVTIKNAAWVVSLRGHQVPGLFLSGRVPDDALAIVVKPEDELPDLGHELLGIL